MHTDASLLLVPYQLSPDWSFNCVPLIEQATDPRNLVTVSLYLFLVVFSIVLLLRLAQPPSRVLLFYLALTVAPFIPAANIFFYVGTFIGERLLYIPSLGFCYLFTHLLVWLAHTAAKWYRRRTRSRRLLRPAELDAPLEVWAFVAALALLLSPCLAYYALRTLSHNTVWKNEESLFLHALQVCPTSAKVQENVGVLERRRRDWPKALNHFQLARAIDPDLCEIDHWMGLTHINAVRTSRTHIISRSLTKSGQHRQGAPFLALWSRLHMVLCELLRRVAEGARGDDREGPGAVAALMGRRVRARGDAPPRGRGGDL